MCSVCTAVGTGYRYELWDLLLAARIKIAVCKSLRNCIPCANHADSLQITWIVNFEAGALGICPTNW